VDATDEAARLARLKARIWRCNALADAGRTSLATREIEQLAEAHGEHPDPLVLHGLAEACGYVAFVRGDLSTMLRAETEALERARALGDSVRIAKALGLLAQALFRVGRNDEALEHARKGARLARLAQAAGVEAELQLAVGLAQARLGGAVDGLDDVQAALAAAERLDIPALRVAAHAQLALLLVERRGEGDAERALEHARRALARAEQDRAQGDTAAADRAVAIADAASQLAERRVALHRERGALEAAKRRLARTKERQAQARRALEAAMQQRAELDAADDDAADDDAADDDAHNDEDHDG